jgi:hypothetical protein
LPTYATLSDTALWNAAVPLDTLFAVGIKQPGTRRGFYRNAWRMSHAAWLEAHTSIAARHGVRVLYVDSLLPMIRVKIDDVMTLAKLRRLPFIDYVEPALIPQQDDFLASGGCGYSPPDVLPPQGPSGDYIPRSFSLSYIDQA